MRWAHIVAELTVAEQPFQIRSVALPLVGRNYLSESPSTSSGLMPLDQLIDEIVNLGANDVRLITCAGIYPGIHADTPDAIRTAGAMPSDVEILTFAQRLKQAGLQITWNPFLSVASDDGSININGLEPTDFAKWMNQHKAMMVHQAELAQSVGAERFMILSDDVQRMLFSVPWDQRLPTSQIVAQWLDLFAAVRSVFKGEITSALAAASNIFAGGNTQIDLIPRPIIEALDIIGVGMVPQPLSSKAAPALQDIIDGWYTNANGDHPLDVLRQVHETYGKPVLLANYASYGFVGAAAEDTAVFGLAPLIPDLQLQADMLDGLLTVMTREEGTWLKGVSLQNFNRWHDYDQGIARFLDSLVGENFQNKPAEQVVSGWFNGLRQGAGLTIPGTAGADVQEGGYHRDMLLASAGNDVLYGGDGIDRAVYAAPRSQFGISASLDGLQLTDTLASRYGSDRLEAVERVVFSDFALAFDTGGAAGTVAKVVGAVFGPAAISNKGYAGIGLMLMDAGMTYVALMQLALDARLGTGASHGAVVELLYTNVVGASPSPAERAHYVGMLESGSVTQVTLGVLAAETALNLTHIDLVGLSSTGLAYQLG